MPRTRLNAVLSASWMPSNHVRAATGITASGLLTIALRLA
jgi:uncharacterized membrane protein